MRNLLSFEKDVSFVDKDYRKMALNRVYYSRLRPIAIARAVPLLFSHNKSTKAAVELRILFDDDVKVVTHLVH